MIAGLSAEEHQTPFMKLLGKRKYSLMTNSAGLPLHDEYHFSHAERNEAYEENPLNPPREVIRGSHFITTNNRSKGLSEDKTAPLVSSSFDGEAFECATTTYLSSININVNNTQHDLTQQHSFSSLTAGHLYFSNAAEPSSSAEHTRKPSFHE
jgi:hypothetical protein